MYVQFDKGHFFLNNYFICDQNIKTFKIPFRIQFNSDYIVLSFIAYIFGLLILVDFWTSAAFILEKNTAYPWQMIIRLMYK
jgi:hypothetical protein